MARIHDTVTIETVSQFPSLGSLIGSRVSSDVFDSINNQGYKSFFGSDFDHIRNDFINRHVKPMDELNFEISRTINLIMNPDRFRILDSIESFQSIPSCMEMAILTFAPVRQGVLEGRMEGFGYAVDSLPEDDDYGRLIDNFTCEDVAAASNEDGYYEITATLYSTDPDLSDDDLYAIRKTRDFIRDKILAETSRDPTAIDLPRG